MHYFWVMSSIRARKSAGIKSCDLFRLGPVSENRKANAFMTRLLTSRERIMAYFQHPSARHAAQYIKGLINRWNL